MTEFQQYLCASMYMEGKAEEATDYFKSCEADNILSTKLPKDEARKKAEALVLFDMGLSDIERECSKRGIQVTKNRSQMEMALIEKITNEYTM